MTAPVSVPVSVQLLDPQAKLPAYGSPDAAGADLYVVADGPVTVAPGGTAKLRTGLALAIPQGYVGLVCARSGMACKRGLAPANKVGIIDADYRGEVMVFLHNHGDEPQVVEPGDRVAQLMVVPVAAPEIEVVDALPETVRGAGGLGSTGR